MPDAGSPAGCCAMPDYWRHTTRTNTAGAVASDRAKARACHRRTVNPLQLLPILYRWVGNHAGYAALALPGRVWATSLGRGIYGYSQSWYGVRLRLPS